MNCAYSSLCYSDDYVGLCIGLYQSYLNTCSIYDFILIVTDNLSAESFNQLNKYKVPYKIFPYYEYKNATARFAGTINKFHALILEYDIILFIDADCIFMGNLDHYFQHYVQNTLIRGTFLFFQPNQDEYDRAFSYSNICRTDEDYLINYSDWNVIDQPKEINDNTLHFMWAPKPHQMLTTEGYLYMVQQIITQRNFDLSNCFLQFQQYFRNRSI